MKSCSNRLDIISFLSNERTNGESLRLQLNAEKDGLMRMNDSTSQSGLNPIPMEADIGCLKVIAEKAGSFWFVQEQDRYFPKFP